MTDVLSSAVSGASSAATGLGSVGMTANFILAAKQGKLHGLAPAFLVKIQPTGGPNYFDLGLWSNASGIKVTWDMQKITTGNYSNRTVSVPKGVQYENVTLKRAMTKYGWLGPMGATTMGIREWLYQMAKNPPKWDDLPTLQITLYDVWANAVAYWEMENAFPVSWEGPSLDATSKNVAMETLVISHSGFLQTTADAPASDSSGPSVSGFGDAAASVGLSF